MDQNSTQVEFERCVEFLARMIELYGAEVLAEIETAETKDSSVA